MLFRDLLNQLDRPAGLLMLENTVIVDRIRRSKEKKIEYGDLKLTGTTTNEAIPVLGL